MLYPLNFTPIYKAKTWGGRTLAERFARDLPDGDIGESWELADLPTTSASGGGGDAARSIVANGPLAGRTLHELIATHGPALVGDLPLTPAGDFPLLVKFLDARENLSVQVHPSPEYAAEHPDAHLKSEAWYVVDAVPGAVIYAGVREGVTPQRFREAIKNDAVADLLVRIPVKPGDCHYLPSGTCHALGAGIVVSEVQTPSDTTLRVYDWGRTGRELHVEQALRCIAFGPVDNAANHPRTRITREHTVVQALVHCEHFRIERLTIDAGHTMPLVTNHQPRVYTVIDGSLRITCEHDDTTAAETDVRAGDTLLLPAHLRDPYLRAETDVTLLDVSFPQATGHLMV